MSSSASTPNLSSPRSDTFPSPPCQDNAAIDWPDLSPIPDEGDQSHEESVDVEVLDDAVVTALSTRSDVGTPSPTFLYPATPTREKARLPATTTTPPRVSSPAIRRSPREPSSVSSSSPHYDVALLLQQSWRKAIRVLRANPSLMTRAILCLALKQRPPVYVVDWMLRLNPDAATAPPSERGPSPLFVAIQEGCSLPVVETVLRACPKALVARPSGSQWDPIAVARRQRAEEKDLLALLHRPASYWLDEKQQDSPDSFSEERNWSKLGAEKRRTTVIPEVIRKDKELDQVRQKLVLSPEPSPRLGIEKRDVPSVSPETKRQRQAIPPLLHRTRPLATTPTASVPPDRSVFQQSSWTAAERQELENVKYLCLSLLKAHRRLLETHGNHQDDTSGAATSSPPPPSNMHLDESERQALLQAMEQRQEEQNRICLIALDMKEKSIRALARRLEERLTNLSSDGKNAESVSSPRLTNQLRSSYVHLYQRFLGLEEELQRLKQATLVTTNSSSSSVSETDSCQAVFDPPPLEQPRMAVYSTKRKHQQEHTSAKNNNRSLDETQSLFSTSVDDEAVARGECSRSCLRWTSFRFRSSSPSSS